MYKNILYLYYIMVKLNSKKQSKNQIKSIKKRNIQYGGMTEQDIEKEIHNLTKERRSIHENCVRLDHAIDKLQRELRALRLEKPMKAEDKKKDDSYLLEFNSNMKEVEKLIQQQLQKLNYEKDKLITEQDKLKDIINEAYEKQKQSKTQLNEIKMKIQEIITNIYHLQTKYNDDIREILAESVSKSDRCNELQDQINILIIEKEQLSIKSATTESRTDTSPPLNSVPESLEEARERILRQSRQWKEDMPNKRQLWDINKQIIDLTKNREIEINNIRSEIEQKLPEIKDILNQIEELNIKKDELNQQQYEDDFRIKSKMKDNIEKELLPHIEIFLTNIKKIDINIDVLQKRITQQLDKIKKCGEAKLLNDWAKLLYQLLNAVIVSNIEYNQEQLDLCSIINNEEKELLKSWFVGETIQQDEKIQQLLLNLKKIMSVDQYNLFLYDNITDQLNNIDEVRTEISRTYASDHQTIAGLDMQHRMVMEKRKDIEKKQQLMIDQFKKSTEL